MPQHLQKSMTLIYVHVCVFFSAWAKVELTMHEAVEVYAGDSAQIPCQYNFTDADNEPSFVMIQWFVVSAGAPVAKPDTTRPLPSRAALHKVNYLISWSGSI